MPMQISFASRRAAFVALLSLACACAARAADWTALARLHDDALRAWQAAPADARAAAATRACETLERAGIVRAADAPLADVTPQRAAQILNDYGFLADRAGLWSDAAEHAIRRALVLDPSRNIAHLNLADALRARLAASVSGEEDVDAARADVRGEYQAFLAGGGKRTRALGHWPDPPPALPPHAGVCEAVQAWLRADRIDELTSRAATRLRLDGRRVDLAPWMEGTGHFASFHVVESATGKALPVMALDGEAMDDAAILSIGGHHQVLIRHVKGGGETVPLDGGPACDIVEDVRETVSPKSAEPALCRRVLDAQGLEEIVPDETPKLSPEAFAARWPTAKMAGSALVDLANDGHPVRVLRLEVEERQPLLCTATLVDFLDEAGTRFLDDAERLALKARGIVGGDPAEPGGSCDAVDHYLRDGRRTLVESREGIADLGGGTIARSVSVLERGRTRALCVSDFKRGYTVTPRPSR